MQSVCRRDQLEGLFVRIEVRPNIGTPLAQGDQSEGQFVAVVSAPYKNILINYLSVCHRDDTGTPKFLQPKGTGSIFRPSPPPASPRKFVRHGRKPASCVSDLPGVPQANALHRHTRLRGSGGSEPRSPRVRPGRAAASLVRTVKFQRVVGVEKITDRSSNSVIGSLFTSTLA